MDAIRTEGLTKHYRVGFWRPRPYVALDSLTFDVARGEVFGFLGPNGAGKTTTLKLLMQLIYPTGGRAEILGRPVGDVGVRRRVGYLPENPYFYEHLTAEELLDYFDALCGCPAAGRRQRSEALLDQVGIGAERRLRLRTLSKGMIQRVGIAQALVNEPDVVMFDEPMSGLDPIGRRDMRHLIVRLRDRGCTVLFSSHLLADAEALCSRVAILADGRLAAIGQLSDFHALHVRGWELIIDGVTAAALERGRELGHIAGVTPLGGSRYAVELPLSAAPELVLPELAAAGCRVVSLNPLRETLEVYFGRQVGTGTHGRRPEA